MSTSGRPSRFPGLGTTSQIFLFVILPLTLLLLAVAFGSLQLHHQATLCLRDGGHTLLDSYLGHTARHGAPGVSRKMQFLQECLSP